MRSLRALAPTAVLAALLSSPLAASAQELRLASLAPADSKWGTLIQELATKVAEGTGGQVKFKLFLGGKLGDESKVVKKLGKGVDGAFFTGQGMGLLLPAYRVQELPFLSETPAEADAVRKAIWAELEAAFEKQTSYVLVGPGETGMVHLFSKKELKGIEELRTAKLWVWEGDNVASDTFKVFSVTPRPLDILTVVQQIKNGGIDTVYNSPAGAVALGWTGDLKFITDKNFAYASGGFALTKDAWAKIPEAQRSKVKEIVTAYGEKIITQARTDNDAAFKKLTAAGGGMVKVVITDAKHKELRDVAIKAWPDLAKSLGATELLAKARATVKK